MRVCAILFVAACSSPSKPPVENQSPPAGSPNPNLAAGETCHVLDQVRAAAPTDFASLRGTKKSDTLFESTARPNAATAVVSNLGPVAGGWTWQASWKTEESVDSELEAMSKQLHACPFGSALTGDGKAHVTERNGPANAFELVDPTAKLTFSVLAEGKQITLTVSRVP